MKNLYYKTDLEKWIESLYRNKGIISPNHLSIPNIAKCFKIEVIYMENAPTRAIWDNDDTTIFLNTSLPDDITRDLFFHELCHPLRHVGAQEKMKNKSFMNLQEVQANQFQLYAAVPFFMIQNLDLITVESIFQTFNVSINLSKRRYEQINRRILQTQIDQDVVANTSVKKADNIWSDETMRVLNKLHSQLKNKKEVFHNA